MVCLGSQHFKGSLPNTSLTPAHVASVNHSKVVKAFGQITPGDTDPITVEHCLHKEAIILSGNSEGALSAG